MISERQELDLLQDIRRLLSPRDPIYQSIMVSAGQPWSVDYHGRKHIFIWFPVTQTLNLEDYGSGPVTGQTWFNLGIEPGIRLSVTSTTLVLMHVKFTDEVIP